MTIKETLTAVGVAVVSFSIVVLLSLALALIASADYSPDANLPEFTNCHIADGHTMCQ